MPYGYKKRGYKKRSYGRKKGGFLNRKYSAMDLASKAWAAAKYVKGLINVEHKFNDVSQSGQQSTTATVTSLSNISEGTDYNQRTGISVRATSLYVKGCIYAFSTQATFGETVRTMIVCDMDNTGSAPSASDILEAPTDVNSALNHTNGQRFKVLFDRNYLISPGGDGGKEFKVYLKPNSHIRWSNSTTGTREGHLYMLQLSTTAVAANEPNVTWYSRLRYVDN
jgi:hypothetical protein